MRNTINHFTFTQRDEIGILEFDTPDSNANILSSHALKELDQQLDAIAALEHVRVLLITSAKKSIFIAGADIKEIESLSDPQDASDKCELGKQIFDKLEKLPQVTIAVINGACVGGGYELSLACDYRVAGFADSIKIGLPEVKLGILPGFGGCVRLPKRIGISKALAMILPGKLVDSRTALKMGLVERLFYDPVLVDEASKFGRNILAGRDKVKTRKPKLVEKLLEGNPIGRSILFRQARKNVWKTTSGHYPAPLAALDAIQAMVGKSHAEASRIESDWLGKLAVTKISKNLIHVFYLDEAYRKRSWTDATTPPAKVEKVGVVGAGVMGGGIAQLLAKKNIVCRIKDLNYGALALALKTAKKLYAYQIKTRRMKQGQVDAQMSLISPTTTYAGFGNVDLVIEAVVERMDVKQQVFKELDEVVQPNACLFTNTSSLRVTEIAESTNRPEKVCGFHFFNPVHRMPLLEIIKTDKTSDETIVIAVAFARQLGKMPIVVGDKEGFIVNRILLPYMNEAAYLFQEGIEPERLDKIVKGFGMPMGPLELADEVGIDVGFHVAQILETAYGPRMRVAPVLSDVDNAGIFGKKSGSGFYVHKGKKASVNPKVLGMRPSADFKHSDEVATKRLIYTMINEASRCLEEGVVDAAATIDVGMIYGTGFPPFRGGLLKYADSVGVKNILADLRAFQTQFDQQRFEPSGLLQKMADSGVNFYAPTNNEGTS
ncbi:Fatty acid oxidation complex subunit alpha [Rubripirellula tenax]|uniref:enoyl-CoA hydratase n=1 Tax=Rubripirellula tenax TaxID=2528015 RepID=A0A5C6FIQ0_9BACT|nr:3-hydroxyacyl-CoA dehydrogenase NAD-binding domain-containing protein [Rubripirellula tenax]TWU60810.1 Fatty acid oxidation complex subunit alpha [Rubripirellula tenax]